MVCYFFDTVGFCEFYASTSNNEWMYLMVAGAGDDVMLKMMIDHGNGDDVMVDGDYVMVGGEDGDADDE